MSLIKVVPYVSGVTKMYAGLPLDPLRPAGDLEPRIYPRSGYFLVSTIRSLALHIFNHKNMCGFISPFLKPLQVCIKKT